MDLLAEIFTFHYNLNILEFPKFRIVLIEESLEVNLPTIWTNEKKIKMCEKVGKSRFTVFFQ